MREDMAKVIVERPRMGGGGKYPRGSRPGRGRVPMEDWHRREGIRRPWHGEEKYLNENLAPLRRYLRSQVGRHWDEVYGDVCQRINRNSAVQLHIWQHLVEYVCTNPYEVAGEVHRGTWSRRLYAFYVDPQTGLLRENADYSRRWSGREQPATPRDRIPVDATREYRRIDGIWYEIELRPLPTPPDNARVYDLVLKQPGPFDRWKLREFYGRAVYAAGKRQLNKREIRRLPEPS